MILENATVKYQSELRSYKYDDHMTGEPREGYAVGLVVGLGDDEIYAELRGEKAKNCPRLDLSKPYNLDVRLSHSVQRAKTSDFVFHKNMATVVSIEEATF